MKSVVVFWKLVVEQSGQSVGGDCGNAGDGRGGGRRGVFVGRVVVPPVTSGGRRRATAVRRPPAAPSAVACPRCRRMLDAIVRDGRHVHASRSRYWLMSCFTNKTEKKTALIVNIIVIGGGGQKRP